MTEETKQEVVETEEVKQEVVTQQPAASGVAASDLLLPRIELLQAMSPKVQQGQGKPGTIVDNLEGNPLGEDGTAVTIIPIRVEKNFIRWFPRDEGGGIMYRTNNGNDPRVVEDTKWIGKEKPKCTAYLNFLCIVEGRTLPIVVSFAMTSYTAGRKLLTMCESGRMEGLEYHDCRYKLSPLVKTNSFGSFFIFGIDKIGPSTSDDKARAKRAMDMFSGKEISFEQESGTATTTSNDHGDEF